MLKFDGKVALITGAARGQGRSHALRMAEEGADIIGIDICEQIDTVAYPMATPADLEDTLKLVEAKDRRMVAVEADVRDRSAMRTAVQEGLSEFGRLDFVVANAGILSIIGDRGRSDQAWHDSIDVMLTGVYNVVEECFPVMVEADRGGCIVITSSTTGFKGIAKNSGDLSPGLIGYTAAKHGVVGLMRIYANGLAPHSIRVNTVHPTGTATPMIVNDQFPEWARQPGNETFGGGLPNALPVPVLEPVDVSNAIVFLCSEEARYVTGVALPVDAGCTIR